MHLQLHGYLCLLLFVWLLICIALQILDQLTLMFYIRVIIVMLRISIIKYIFRILIFLLLKFVFFISGSLILCREYILSILYYCFIPTKSWYIQLLSYFYFVYIFYIIYFNFFHIYHPVLIY